MKDATSDALQEAKAKKRVHRLAKSGRLREMREDGGLSQADVGRALEVDPSRVSRWENDGGKSLPRGRQAIALLELLDGEGI